MSGALFKENSNGKIKYNHPQLSGTYKALKGLQEQQIRKAKEINLNYKDYKGKKTAKSNIHFKQNCKKIYYRIPQGNHTKT